MIVPTAPLWDALLPGGRERVINWARQSPTGVQPPAPVPALGAPAAARDPAPLVGSLAVSVRLVSAMQTERRRGMLIRTWRDAGLLVGTALAGATVAIYVQPPLTRSFTWSVATWAIAVIVLARHATRRARGRSMMGTPEANAEYHADPERFALGGVHSISLGASLGIAAMLAALLAKSP